MDIRPANGVNDKGQITGHVGYTTVPGALFD